MRILLLSAYAAHSHVLWQESLQAMFPDWEWRVLSLPPRHFSWRIRGNPLYWSVTERDILESGYDLLLATSMVDLATLRGLVPALCSLPSVLYFHENQFEYPPGRARHSPLEAQMVSLYAALAADRLAFNSAFNRDSFLAGCEALLGKLPDRVPRGIVSRLRERSTVLPVPFDCAQRPVPGGASQPWPGRGRPDGRPLRLLWAARFEHDKGGDGLLLTLRELERIGLDYQLAVVGQQFRNSPGCFQCIENEFAHRLVCFGFVPQRADLHALMCGADLVLSTALHEFQGLAVMEAVAAGCIPVVPDRLVYPELYPAACRYPSLQAQPEAEAVGAARLVVALAARLASGELEVPDLENYTRGGLVQHYRSLFQSLARGGAG